MNFKIVLITLLVALLGLLLRAVKNGLGRMLVLLLLTAAPAWAQQYSWTTLAGRSDAFGTTDGTGSAARFDGASPVAADAAGNIYVAEPLNQIIRKVTPSGVVTTLAGQPLVSGSANGTGSAARFNTPQGVAVDGSGNLYVGDRENGTIRKVTSGGVVTTLAGSAGVFGSADGTGSAARFDHPMGVAVDGSGNVYVADNVNNTIRKVTPGGLVTTLAGSPGASGNADGTGSAARFSGPNDVTVDAIGNVYVADSANGAIRKVTPSAVVSTLAFGFSNPTGVAVDGSGNVFLTDGFGGNIYKVTPGGTASLIGAEGSPPTVEFGMSFGMTVDRSGIVYVGAENSILRATPPINTPVVVLDVSGSPQTTTATLNGTVNPKGNATTAGFEYGLTTSYGNTANVTLSPTNDSTVHHVSASLTGLTGGTTYHYRLTATNSKGTVSSIDATFTTLLAPEQNWKQAGYGNPNLSDTAAPDGDGIPVLVKYALVLPPGQSDASNLPVGQVRVYVEGKRLAIVFTRDTTRNDIEMDVEAADSPAGPWTALATSVNGAAFSGAGFVSETDAGNGLKTVEARDTVNISSAARRFMHIKVVH